MSASTRTNTTTDQKHDIVADDLKFICDRFSERSSLKDVTCLITGCAGFVGFYLTHFLVKYADELGIRVFVFLQRRRNSLNTFPTLF